MVRGKAVSRGLRFAPGPGCKGQAGGAGGLGTAVGSCLDSPWLGAQARVGIPLPSLSGFGFLPEAPGAAGTPARPRSPAAAPRTWGQVPLRGDQAAQPGAAGATCAAWLPVLAPRDGAGGGQHHGGGL